MLFQPHFPCDDLFRGLSFPPRTADRCRFSQRGFSIMEVTLALGIVAIACVSIIALVPAGIQGFRSAMDQTLGSQIVKRLINEAQQTDYRELIKITADQPMTRYFDDAGTELAADKQHVYTAELTVVAPTLLPKTTTPASPSLATVTVKLAYNPRRLVAPFRIPGFPFETYTALIADNQ
jgi:uncharacterized protein (TIGR02598 family)